MSKYQVTLASGEVVECDSQLEADCVRWAEQWEKRDAAKAAKRAKKAGN